MLDEIEELIDEREHWEVQRRLLISPFSFHKEVMYRDLLQNAEIIARRPRRPRARSRRRRKFRA